MVLDYIQGKPIVLFGFVSPKLEVGISFRFKIPVPLFPIVKIIFTGGLDITLRIHYQTNKFFRWLS